MSQLWFLVSGDDVVTRDLLLMWLVRVPTMVAASAFAASDDASVGVAGVYHVGAVTAAFRA